jgi:dihydrofolate synthase/folylpolyglutamate synthase
VAGPLWIDGAHNPQAAEEVARSLPAGVSTLVIGVLANKDAAGVLAPLLRAGINNIVGVPVPGHAHQAPDHLARLAAQLGASSIDTADTLPDAVSRVREGGTLIAGSLYLAGRALELNGELPD